MLEKSLSLPFVRFLATGVGVCVVLFGLADIASRLGAANLGSFSAVTIFGSPAAQDVLSRTQATPGLLSQTVASTTPIVPLYLSIPAIGVRAPVDGVGTTSAGAMATPKNFLHVGWYALGAQPGQAGSAVFAGHVNNALTKAGVFEHLSQVKIGDTISIEGAGSTMLEYVVTEVDEYPAKGAPSASIFATTGSSQIVLITCDGSWDGSAHSFDKRFVVYAHLSAPAELHSL